MAKKHPLEITYLIVGIIMALITIGSHLGLVKQTSFQGYSDGYTLYGSNLQITNLVVTPDKVTSLYWNMCGSPATSSSDQDIMLNTVPTSGFIQSLAGCGTTGYGYKGQVAISKIPLGTNKIRASITIGMSTTNIANGNAGINIIDGSNKIVKNIFIKSQGNTVQSTGYTVLLESYPNLINNKTDIYLNGDKVYTFNRSQKLYPAIYAGIGSSSSGGSSIEIKNFRYQPLLACTKDASDLNAVQSFGAGTVVSLNSFRFPVKQFCFSTPTLVVTGNQSGVDFGSSSILYDTLAQGQSLTVPANTVWTIPYIFDNSQGLVSVVCSAGQAVNENGVCVQQTGIVNTASQGTQNNAQSTLLVQPVNACESLVGAKGIWVVDTTVQGGGYCKIPQPVAQYCDLNSNTPCELRVSTLCPTMNLDFDPTTNFCVAKITKTDTGEAKIEQPITSGISWVTWLLAGTTVLFFLLYLFMLIKRKVK